MQSTLFELVLPWINIISVQVYGFGLFIATFLFYIIFIKRCSYYVNKKHSQDLFLQLSLIFFITSFFCYKINLLFNYHYIKERPLNGFAYTIGFISAVIFLIIKYRKKSELLFKLLDITSNSLLPSIIVVYTAAFFSGSNFGTPLFDFPGVKINYNPLQIPLFHKVHPVQLYYVANAIILSIIIILGRRKTRINGFSFITLIIIWPLFSAVTEFFRGDLNKLIFGLTPFQITVIFYFILYIPIFFILNIKLNLLNKLRGYYLKPVHGSLSLVNLFLFRVENLKDFFFQIKFVLIVLFSLFLCNIPGQYWKNINIENLKAIYIPDDSDKIFINIPANTLIFKEKQYKISAGRPQYQTPIGTGIVKDKRKAIRFVYTIGWRKGEIIKYGHDLKGRIFKMPYNKMRGLGLIINNYSIM